MTEASYSGVYIIKNSINNRVYVGSSGNIKKRWSDHKRDLMAEKHHSQSLQADWEEYGSESFVFEVLERIEGLDERILAEKNYIIQLSSKKIDAVYNVIHVPISWMSEEERNECRQEGGSAFTEINIDKLISFLEQSKVIRKIQDKRITTTEMPTSLYLQMAIASLARKKSITNCLLAALEFFTEEFQSEHMNEIKLQAAAAGMGIEEYLADAIAKRLL
jgi:group I intron endonuclease